MKKKIFILFIPLCILLIVIGFILVKPKKINKQPDITQIRTICNLATLETYYHNVAKCDKKAQSGITHLFEKDRELWIEYTGTAKIGIDMSKVDMKIDGENITVVMPNAKLLSIDIGEINKESYIYSDDNWVNKNEFTPEEETTAINTAQNKMEESVKNNSQLLLTAQTRAQDLIEQYINQLGEISGIPYQIKWVYE